MSRHPFRNNPVEENGTWRFDVGGGRFVRAVPTGDDLFSTRAVHDGSRIGPVTTMTAEQVDFLVEGWEMVVKWYSNDIETVDEPWEVEE